MKRFSHVIALVLLLQLTVGCAVLSKKECEQVNWSQEGYNTGFNERNSEKVLGYYREHCGQEYGIHPDLRSFDEAHKRGVEALCTREGGYKYGSRGGVYAGSCKKEKEDEFFIGYQRGQSIYMTTQIRDLQSEVKVLKSELDSKQSQINDLKSENDDLRRKVNN